MHITDRIHRMYKDFQRTIEYQILMRFLLTTELMYLALVLIFMCGAELDGDGFLQYYNLHNEGYKTVTVFEHVEEKEKIFSVMYDILYNEKIEKKINRLKCSVTIDGEEYLFKADAVDVIGQNNRKEAYYSAKEKRKVGGYVFSSSDRTKLIFSYDIDNAWKLFAQKAKQHFEFRYIDCLIYKFLLYLGMVILILNKFKITDQKTVADVIWDKIFKSKIFDFYVLIVHRFRLSELRKHKKPEISKENYSNKAIKQNPEYRLLEKESVNQRYSAETVLALENIKCGDYRVSAKQKEALKEEIKKWNDHSILEGPILANNPTGHEAVLLKIGWKRPFTRKRWAKVIERTREGDFAERKFKIDFSAVRNISGNYVIVVKNGAEIGIYEDSIKNQTLLMIQNYDDYMKELRETQRIYGIEQSLLIIGPALLVVLAWICTRNWLIFPEVALCFVVAGTYKYFIYRLGLKYISKYGKTVYENDLIKWWKGWYALLILFAVYITI